MNEFGERRRCRGGVVGVGGAIGSSRRDTSVFRRHCRHSLFACFSGPSSERRRRSSSNNSERLSDVEAAASAESALAGSAASFGTKRPLCALLPPFFLCAFLRVFVGKEKVIFEEELGEVKRHRSGGVSGIGVDGFGDAVGVRDRSVGGVGGGVVSEGTSGGAEDIGAGVGSAIGSSRKAPAYPRKPGGETIPPSSLCLLFHVVFVGGQKESPPDR